MTIRLAAETDVGQIPVTLARAFVNDPWIDRTVDATRCGAEGVPAPTDTSTEISVRCYAEQGFEVVGEEQVDGGGPHVWFLRREPRP